MSAEAVVIPRTRRHTVQSSHVGAEFEIWMAEPETSPRPTGAPSRVLYVMDADLFFGTAVEMTRIMTRLFGELPPLLVVGIAYPTDDPRISGELRNRDFTPTAVQGFEEMARRMRPDWEPLLPEGERMGGADRFLSFLIDEVRPFVESRVQSAPEESILFGSSLGGLFTLYSLLTIPASFDHYIAASPSIWWDSELLFELEERLAEDTEDVSARVFLAAGGLEEDASVPFLARFKTVTNVRLMAERLQGRSYPSMSVRGEVIEGETHTTVIPAVLTRGLRWILSPPG